MQADACAVFVIEYFFQQYLLREESFTVFESDFKYASLQTWFVTTHNLKLIQDEYMYFVYTGRCENTKRGFFSEVGHVQTFEVKYICISSFLNKGERQDVI